MCFRAQRAERNARGHQAFADFCDALHLIDRDRRAVLFEVQQIAEEDRRTRMHPVTVALVERIGFRPHGRLQYVDQLAVVAMPFAARTVFVEPTNR